ncbi:MAG: heavy metal-associated domain-containing protein [Patescibacteria group bacterium]
MKTIISVQGMHCPSCKFLLEDACKELPQVQDCNADFMNGQVEIEHTPDLDWRALQAKVEQLGQYTVRLAAS